MKLIVLFMLSSCYLLTGCFTYYNSVSDPFPYPKETIWSTAYKVLDKHYEIATANKEEGTIDTDWNYKLSPVYLESYRDRVTLLIEKYDETQDPKKQDEIDEPDTIKDENAKEKFVVKISVERHQNKSLDSPNSKDDGFWFPDGFNRREEQRLINFIYSQLSIMQYME